MGAAYTRRRTGTVVAVHADVQRIETRGSALVLVLYLVALDAVFAADPLRNVLAERGAAIALGWAALRLAGVGAVAWLLVCQRRAVATGAFLLVTSAYVVDLAVRGINGDGLTPATLRLAAGEGGSYGGAALRVVGGSACVWALLAIGLMHVLWILVRDVLTLRTLHPGRPAGLLVFAMALSLLLPSPSFLPAFVQPLVAVADVALHPQREPARAPVVAVPAEPPRAMQIVLLVDESIRGDLLSLARPETRTTPWLEAHRTSFVDLGVAAATANCSAIAHAALLTGLLPEDLPDLRGEIRRRPTLFGAAARAGLRTVLVDAQASAASPTLALAADDLGRLSAARIVRAEQPTLTAAERDGALAEMVVDETAGAPTFVYAIKRGAHYPYDDAVPPEHRTHTAAEAHALGFQAAEEAEVARYLDALTYAVDGFLASLLPRLEGRDVLLFYTSDHGESLLENGHTRTHCSEGRAPPEQGRVPLLVWASGPAASHLAELRARRPSAFRLHPTLLRAFGFAPGAPSLFDEGDDARRFYSGDALGRSPTWWNPIDGEPTR